MKRADVFRLAAFAALVVLVDDPTGFDRRLLAAGRDPFDAPHYRRLG